MMKINSFFIIINSFFMLALVHKKCTSAISIKTIYFDEITVYYDENKQFLHHNKQFFHASTCAQKVHKCYLHKNYLFPPKQANFSCFSLILSNRALAI